MKSAAVFDFGGVVFRWAPLELLRRAVPQHAADDAAARALASHVFQGFVPGSDWALFDLGRIEAGDLAQRIARRCGLPPADIARIIDAVPDHLEPQAGTVALMQALRDRGHPLFYLSNMPVPYADHLERSHAFFEWFEGGIFSGRVGIIKPLPAMFELARERFGIDPPRSVFIDDHAGNIDAARAMGWNAIHFTDPQQCGQALQAAGWL